MLITFSANFTFLDLCNKESTRLTYTRTKLELGKIPLERSKSVRVNALARLIALVPAAPVCHRSAASLGLIDLGSARFGVPDYG
jgi:hypothetical protein